MVESSYVESSTPWMTFRSSYLKVHQFKMIVLDENGKPSVHFWKYKYLKVAFWAFG